MARRAKPPTREDAEAMRDKALAKLKKLQASKTPERVADQIAIATQQSLYWQAVQMLCTFQHADLAESSKDLTGKEAVAASRVQLKVCAEARACSAEARYWEEQKTRAKKQSISDRVDDLEKADKAKSQQARKLAVLDGGAAAMG